MASSMRLRQGVSPCGVTSLRGHPVFPRHVLQRPLSSICVPSRAPSRSLAARAVQQDAPDAPGTPATAAAAATAVAAPPTWQWEESGDATWAYGVFFGVLALGSFPILQQTSVGDLPYFISLAVCTIYIGAHRGLTTKNRQQISLKEGALAPFAASASLFGLWLLIKYIPGFSIQTLVDVYFWVLGSTAIGTALVPVLRNVGGPLGSKSFVLDPPEGLLLDERGKSIRKLDVAPTDFAAVALAVGLATAELASHHTNFTLNNMVACLVATDILQLIGLRSFRAATLLLVGLLAYDTFWVFGSPQVVGDNVMLTVATSNVITGPTRLLFPRIPGGMGEAAEFPFSLLGLGDIAVPGLLACLALRYDASRSTDMRARAVAAADAINSALKDLEPGSTGTEMANAAADAAEAAYDQVADQELRQRDNTLNGSTSSSSTGGEEGGEARMPVSDAALQQRAYFTPVMVAYILGLVTAFAANSITHLGQPALLYIVPSTLLAVLLTGLQRQEVGRLWTFTDVPTFGVAAALAEEMKGPKSDGTAN